MSVLLQKLDFDIEILVGDDNSTDDSFNIAKRMEKFYESERVKFKIRRNESNLGEINNTKSLLNSSEGEYIAYLDADDFWIDPLKLTKQIEFMDRNKDYSLCVTGQINFQNGTYIPTSDFSYWLCPVNLEKMSSEDLSSGNVVGSSSSRFFRNYPDIIKDYFYEFPYSDWPMNFELSLRGKIKYLDFPGYVYTIHKDSLSEKDLNPSLDSQNLYNKRTNILREILEQNNIINLEK
jgi:glycosyltransferase involved in cell wall biosynthesis